MRNTQIKNVKFSISVWTFPCLKREGIRVFPNLGSLGYSDMSLGQGHPLLLRTKTEVFILEDVFLLTKY